jgi:hypothetical protein
MQSKDCIQKTVGQFRRVELVPGLVLFGSEEVEGNPCKFCTLGGIQNWTWNQNKTLELTL